MFTSEQYELLDIGEGRKIERFGKFIVERPAPAAESAHWLRAKETLDVHASYHGSSGREGRWSGELPENWRISHDLATFELKPTSFGQVGVFPEQAENWEWIANRVRQAGRPLKVLNLFAYTGGSTQAAASAGAEVTHVDAAKGVVAWARRNAELSGLESAPIRWVVEDAAKFVRRELRRGNHYDAVVLDPPSYGHGPGGETWKLSNDLMPLLGQCGELTTQRRAFVLLTCHTPGFGPAELEACLADAVFGHCGSGARAKQLVLRCGDGRTLSSGVAVRWP